MPENRTLITDENYRFYHTSCLDMLECEDNSIALTITSPPYWNAIDYDTHTRDNEAWYRERNYDGLGKTYKNWLTTLKKIFSEVYRVTIDGGFCAIVIGTILHKGKHYPAPFDLTSELSNTDWNFHQDIIWNKVTGGVRRAGSFIQHQKSGYYYPNIMMKILVSRSLWQYRISTPNGLRNSGEATSLCITRNGSPQHFRKKLKKPTADF